MSKLQAPASGTTFYRTYKRCDSENNNGIKNALSGIMGNDFNLLDCWPPDWRLFVAIFMDHENGDNKGKPRDDTCKACWMKETL